MGPPTHTAEDVVLGEGGPAAILTGVLGILCPLRSSRHVDDIVEEGLVHLAQVGSLGGPVVHLNVDVGMDVGIPVVGIGRLVGPYTLQVIGQGHAA